MLYPQDLHDGKVCAHGHTRVTALKVAQRYRGHSGALGRLLSGQPATQTGKPQPLAELFKTAFGNGQQRGNFLGHRGIITPL